MNDTANTFFRVVKGQENKRLKDTEDDEDLVKLEEQIKMAAYKRSGSNEELESAFDLKAL